MMAEYFGMKSKFDIIAHLTSNKENADEEVYRKYAMTYYIDIMLNAYKMKYKKEKTVK